MRRLLKFFVENSLFGDLLTVVIILLGVASLFQIRREIFPNVNFDIIQVQTIFPAASPDEVERLVTNYVEQEIQEIDGIKKVQSFSLEGLSQIYIYLDPDRTTSEEAEADIKNVIDRLTDLPEQVEKPLVVALETKQGPVIEVSLAGNIPELELRKAARLFEKEIESVPGVARVVFSGLRKLEIRVEVDLRRLANHRLSLQDLITALKSQNVTIPGGVIEINAQGENGTEKIVRTIGDFANIDDVKKTVIRSNDFGTGVRVGDVAQVFMDQARSTVLTRTNGLPSINLTVLQKENTDAIDMVDQVRERVNGLKKQIDPKIQISFINDFSDFIRRRLSIVTGNLVIGLLLVLLTLPLLIPFRFSLIVALGEPFAFLGTILLLYWTGHSINLISMVGLIIVSGILVDDSIVVTENAVRLVQSGKSPREAAIRGTLQIMAPVFASVMTAVMAFLPMAFMSGIFGKFVREVPIAVLTALAVSLFETFFILPAHIAHWIKAENFTMENGLTAAAVDRPRRSLVGRLKSATDWTQRKWDASVVPAYLVWLKGSLKHRYWVMAGLFVFFVGSMGLAIGVMKVVLFPPDGIEIFYIQTETPVGISLQQHAKLLKEIEQKVQALPPIELQDFTTTVGLVQQDPNDPNTQRGSEFAQLTVLLTPEANRTRKATDIIEDLRVKIGKVPGIDRIAFTRVNSGPPVGKPVSLGVRGREFKDILVVVKDLEERLSKFKGVFDIRNSYRFGKEEVRVQVNSSEAAAAQLSVATIGSSVRAAYEGMVATSIRELDEEIDVRVSLSGSNRSTSESLNDLLIPNSMGNLIPLNRVARFTSGRGLSDIRHEASQRQIAVTADLDTKVTSAIEVNNKVREILPELNQKYPGIEIFFGGEDEDTQESFASLGRAFILAIAGIFLILVLTFKTLLQPLIVLLTIPLGVVSVIWAFFLHGLPFSFMGMLGIVALAGVIVNNAIVFTDFVNQARKEGMTPMDSIMEAAKSRLRPIFLTTITTVIGILPAAYGIGGQDMFVVPIAMALGWGLLFGSILTAFVFPAALAILDDVYALLKRRRK